MIVYTMRRLEELVIARLALLMSWISNLHCMYVCMYVCTRKCMRWLVELRSALCFYYLQCVLVTQVAEHAHTFNAQARHILSFKRSFSNDLTRTQRPR